LAPDFHLVINNVQTQVNTTVGFPANFETLSRFMSLGLAG